MYGTRIKDARKLAHETQSDLGNLLGVSQRTISGWEEELREPPFSAILMICDHYDMSLDYFFGKSDTKRPKPLDISALPALTSSLLTPEAIPKTKEELDAFIRGFLYAYSMK